MQSIKKSQNFDIKFLSNKKLNSAINKLQKEAKNVREVENKETQRVWESMEELIKMSFHIHRVWGLIT